MITLNELRFSGERRTPLIRQAEGSECGLACLAMVAGYHGYETDLIALRRQHQVSLKGATLKHLMGVAEQIGFSARPLRGDLKDLAHVELPAILHWDLSHFVVLTRITNGFRGRRYHIHDPATGIRVLHEQEFGRRFTGVVLELVKSSRFQPHIDQTRLKVHQLWSHVTGFWPVFWQILTLSAILQLLALVAPLFMQISIDTVLPSFDASLLTVLAFGFAGIAVVSMLTSWTRALVLVRLGSSLSYQVTVNLFQHLLRLPLPWFERRHVGDVISRFSSTKPISDLLSQGLIAAIIDGVMAVITLGLMFVYSPVLSAIAIAALALVVCLRVGFFNTLQLSNVNMIASAARENSAFIETLRGIATVKAFGEESNRQRFWQHRKAEAVNQEIKTGRLNAGFSAGEQFIMAMERVLFVYFAVKFAMAGTLSLGVIFALQSYRQQFLDATIRFIQQVISLRLMNMHLVRIADIALSPPEPAARAVLTTTGRAEPVRITLQEVRFRYAPNEPEVLTGVNMEVGAGEMIALVGASGGGKTTLLKIMMGLLAPTSGLVLINGEPLASYGVARWRRETSSVAQDDVLFAGSLSDNICMFDPEPDSERIVDAAKSAAIHAEINGMPMRYHTPVGDMGSVLSGGQKQRVMLARALYRQPSALFLDEATAHLDPESECLVGDAVRELSASRVLIAHRPQTILRADRVYSLKDGQTIALDGASTSSRLG